MTIEKEQTPISPPTEINTGDFHSERKSPSTPLQEANRAVILLQTFMEAMAQARDVPSAIFGTLECVCLATGWTVGENWRRNHGGSRLECDPVWYNGGHRAEAFHNTRVSLTFASGVGLAGRAWASKEPEWIADAVSDSAIAKTDLADHSGALTAAAVPVLIGGEVEFVLEFFVFDIREASQSDLWLLTTMATMLSWVIQKFRAVSAMQESIERFEVALRGSLDGIWDIKLSPGEPWYAPGQTIYFSPRCMELLGYQNDELENGIDSWLSRLHPEDRQRAMQAVSDHLERRIPYEVEYRILHKSGAYRWFSSRGQAIWNNRGQPLRMAGAVRDVTERKQCERMMVQTEKMAAVGQLAAGIAHDLNNPLHAILGFAQGLLEEMQGTGPFSEPLTFIQQEAVRCQKLVQNLLTFSRLDKNGVVPTSPVELLQSILPLIETQARINHVKIDKELQAELPLIKVDRAQIHQVLINLCTNALDAMPNGGHLILGVAIKRRPLDDAACLVFSVTDTGSGIDPKIKERIFEPFFTTKKTGEGTGLGLSLAYEIARHYHGQITVSSEVGKGSTFELFLPLNG